MKGYINVGGETACSFITLAVLAFVYDGDREGIALARAFRDADGNGPPVDQMVSYLLCEEGRLLGPAILTCPKCGFSAE